MRMILLLLLMGCVIVVVVILAMAVQLFESVKGESPDESLDRRQ